MFAYHATFVLALGLSFVTIGVTMVLLAMKEQIDALREQVVELDSRLTDAEILIGDPDLEDLDKEDEWSLGGDDEISFRGSY